MNPDLSRRAFLGAAGSFGLLAMLPGCARSVPGSIARPAPGEAGHFLSAHELDTLRAVTAQFVPGPPDDPDPGAVEAGVAEAIDLLLGAFNLPVPPIHAGGPFSGRAGGTHDDFADFVPMDAFAELGWRIRIEGSLGLPEREFAGPVTGLQEIYRAGLAHLDERAQQLFSADFADASAQQQQLLLSDQTDGDLQTFAGAALGHTFEFMYGAPEYGGNRNLAGWIYTRWDGDVQPRGYTDAQVSQPGANPLLLPDGAVALLERFLGGIAGARAAQRARRRR